MSPATAEHGHPGGYFNLVLKSAHTENLMHSFQTSSLRLLSMTSRKLRCGEYVELHIECVRYTQAN